MRTRSGWRSRTAARRSTPLISGMRWSLTTTWAPLRVEELEGLLAAALAQSTSHGSFRSRRLTAFRMLTSSSTNRTACFRIAPDLRAHRAPGPRFFKGRAKRRSNFRREINDLDGDGEIPCEGFRPVRGIARAAPRKPARKLPTGFRAPARAAAAQLPAQGARAAGAGRLPPPAAAPAGPGRRSAVPRPGRPGFGTPPALFLPRLRGPAYFPNEMVVCAWCDTPVVNPAGAPRALQGSAPLPAVSHGLCPTCLASRLAALPPRGAAPALAFR